jgi:hypothetical protein
MKKQIFLYSLITNMIRFYTIIMNLESLKTYMCIQIYGYLYTIHLYLYQHQFMKRPRQNNVFYIFVYMNAYKYAFIKIYKIYV